MDVAAEMLDGLLQPIRNWEDTILFYTAVTPLAVVSLLELLHDVYTAESGVNSFIQRFNWSIPLGFYRVG